jgi:hypothetical protein
MTHYVHLRTTFRTDLFFFRQGVLYCFHGQVGKSFLFFFLPTAPAGVGDLFYRRFRFALIGLVLRFVE